MSYPALKKCFDAVEVGAARCLMSRTGSSQTFWVP